MCIVYQHVVLTTPVLQPPATCQKGRRTITPVGGIENQAFLTLSFQRRHN